MKINVFWKQKNFTGRHQRGVGCHISMKFPSLFSCFAWRPVDLGKFTENSLLKEKKIACGGVIRYGD
jgi:hypothetical protein